MNQRKTAVMKLISAMVIFGSIGIFVRHIDLPSSLIALVRAIVGVVFLLAVILLRKRHLSATAIGKNLLLLCFSGTAIGFNWILLFESYRFTSVAVGTLCYYMAPIFVILLSPLALKERLSLKKMLCIIAAMVGMVLISGLGTVSLGASGTVKGILFGLGAAALYASVMLMNKHMIGMDAFDKTIIQLSVAAIVLLPYDLLTIDWTGLSPNLTAVILMGFVGIVHTGLAYYLYFGSMDHLSGQTVAILSYIDPAVAVLASVVLLQEPFQWIQGLGATLIIGSAVISEIPGKQRR